MTKLDASQLLHGSTLYNFDQEEEKSLCGEVTRDQCEEMAGTAVGSSLMSSEPNEPLEASPEGWINCATCVPLIGARRQRLVCEAMCAVRQKHRSVLNAIVDKTPSQRCSSRVEVDAHRKRAGYKQAFSESYEATSALHGSAYYKSDESTAIFFSAMFEEMLKRGFIFYG